MHIGVHISPCNGASRFNRNRIRRVRFITECSRTFHYLYVCFCVIRTRTLVILYHPVMVTLRVNDRCSYLCVWICLLEGLCQIRLPVYHVYRFCNSYVLSVRCVSRRSCDIEVSHCSPFFRNTVIVECEFTWPRPFGL